MAKKTNENIIQDDDDFFCPSEMQSFEVIHKLKSNPKLGLKASELKARRKIFGQNILRSELTLSLKQSLRDQVKSLMGVFLIFASIVMYIFDRKPVYPAIAVTVTVIMIFNAVLEYRASRAIGVPRRYSSIKALVTRDGRTFYADSRTLVPGDIITVEESMVIPADCRLIEDYDGLSVLETHLTENNEPVAKDSNVLSGRTETLYHKNMLYAGSIVVSGGGSAVVCFTGEDTLVRKKRFGSKELSFPRLLRYVRMASSAFSLTSIIAAFVLIALGVLSGNDITNVFILSLSVGTASLCDSAVSLADAAFGFGLKRMAKDGAVVKNFDCISPLCEINTVMSRSETLFPPARMSVDEVFIDNTFYSSDTLYRGRTLEILKYALLCSDLQVDESSHRKSGRSAFRGTRCDEAIAYAIDGQEIDIRTLADDYFRMDVRHSADGNPSVVLMLHNGKSIAIERGAPEEILARCNGYSYKGQTFRLSELTRKKFLEAIREKGKNSSYMVGISVCESKAQSLNDETALKKRLFMGFITCSSFMAIDTASSIYRCRNAGIETAVLSSAPYYSALARAKDSGIITDESQICTSDIMQSDNIGLFIANCPDYRLFLNLTDEEWYQILLYRKQDKKHVAVTAEKTQELQMMREADVSLAVEDAPDVLRQSADVITLSGGFRVISDCLHNARMIFVRIHSLAEYLTVAFVTLFLTCAAGLFLPFTPVRCEEILFGGIIFNLLFAVSLSFMPQNRAMIRESLPAYAAKPYISDFLPAAVYSVGCAAVICGVSAITQSYACVLISLTLLLFFAAFAGIQRRGCFGKKAFANNLLLAVFAFCALATALLILFPPLSEAFGYSLSNAFLLIPATLIPTGYFVLYQLIIYIKETQRLKNNI